MWWVAGTVVCFLLVTVGVIVLARSSTASWEAQSRARGTAPAPPAGGAPATLRTELVRTVAAVGVALVHARRSLGAVGALVHRHLPRGSRH